ncbi:transcriptional regulator [Bacillus thuringiensis serovar tolworthi]|uniref:Transcriptional regulator n=1 Tax=Bacillus thuringiensis subsp. tolworthi TaxID=1442 RepID=A0A9W4A141_BACTO|nr:transcriptional regulator [Bacillus thuringiensis serovar tolworthi]
MFWILGIISFVGVVGMSIATVEKPLNIPSNYCIEVNTEGFRDIVALVDINNVLEFSLEEKCFF